MAELIVVLLVVAILAVLALPTLTASRRQTLFSEMQRQIVASLNEAIHEAMSQQTPITFRYDDSAKRMLIYGGGFGALGDSKNKIKDLSENGLNASEIIYGQPSGAPPSLPDTSNMTQLSQGVVDLTFQSDGSVIDNFNNPKNNALFFFNSKNSQTTAFAITILGTGGRVKIWRYNKNIKLYVE